MWKCFNVTPVYKGSSVDDLSNYQPISVVSVAAHGGKMSKIYIADLLNPFEG